MSRRKMPHNNRLSGSAALRTNDMWSKTIGHDPYANQQVDTIDLMSQNNMASQSASLLLLAKMSNLSGIESRGGCTKCGALGHLTFQCRNKVSSIVANNDDDSSSSSSSDDDDDDDNNNNTIVNNKDNISTQIHIGTSTKDNKSSTKKRNRSDRDHVSELEHKSSSKHKKHKQKDSKKSKKDKKSKKAKHSK